MTFSAAGWKEASLGEICTFKYGKSLPQTIRKGGDFSVYGSNGVVGQHDAAITTGQTIVIGRKGSYGEINYSRGPCWPIDTAYFVDETSTQQDIKWLSYRLASLGLNQLNKAAAVPGLNREDAYRQLLLVPPLPVQRRIAAILDQTDVLRAKRQEALAQLDKLTNSLFQFVFGAPAEAEQRYELVRLGDVTRFIDYRGISPNKQASGVRLVTARNIKRGWFEENPKEFIPAEEYVAWMRRGMPRTGDILFTTEGHTLGSAAKLPYFEKVALAQRLIALQPNENLASDYLLHIVLSREFQQEIVRRATGSAAKGISSKQLAMVMLPLPPMTLQQTFARQIQIIGQLKAVQIAELQTLDSLFASLQHRAFRGEL